MKVIFLLCFFSINTSLVAQQNPLTDFHQLDSLANVYMEKAEYKEGLIIAKKNVAQVKEYLGEQDTLYAKALDRLGTLYFYLGQYDQVEPIFKKIVVLREALLPADHPDLAAALSNLSLLYDSQGFYQKALPLSIRAVEIDKKHFGETHENYSISINNLGLLYYSMSDYRKAKSCFLTSLHIDKQVLGEDDPDYLSSLHNLAMIYKALRDYKKAHKYFQQTIRLRKKVLGPTHPATLSSLSSFGNLNALIGNYDLALKIQLEATALTQKVLGADHPNYGTKISDLGHLYNHIGDYPEAEIYYLKALKIYEKALGKEHPSYTSTFANLSQVYIRMSRYRDAELMGRQSLEAIKNTMGTSNDAYSYALIALAEVYRLTKKPYEALDLFKEVLALDSKRLGMENATIGTNYLNLAVNYADLKVYDQAILHYEQALDVFEKALGTSHPKYAFTIQSLACIYHTKKDYPKAKTLFLQALKIYEQKYGPSSFKLISTLNDLARHYNYTSLPKAKMFINRAIRVNSKSKIDSNLGPSTIIDLCTNADFWDVQLALVSIDRLVMIQIDLYATTQDLENLKAALQSLKGLTILANRVQRQLTVQEDQMLTVKYTNNATIYGLKTCHRLYKITQDKQYLNQGIHFAENNKSTVLLASLSNEKALVFGEIPDSLVRLERGLKKRIAELNKKLMELEKGQNKSKSKVIKDDLVESTLEQEALKKQLSKDYPKYNQLKQQTEVVTQEAIQDNLLDEESALLEYIIHDTFVYLILVTKTTTDIFPIHKGHQLNALVKKFRASLHNYQLIFKQPKEAAAIYQVSAHQLYKKLLVPAKDQLKGIKKLFIIADGLLGHIPFEALLTQQVEQGKTLDYSQLPYLIRDVSITYSYSAALLLQNKKNSTQARQNNGQIIGFAADYPSIDSLGLSRRPMSQQVLRTQLETLPATKQEVKGLKSLFGKGAFFFDLDANESNFKQYAADYAVIHLAMHGVLNQQRPLLSSLAFSENLDSLEDNFLEAHEISHLQLNSDLVVLSACETGFGKFEKGEGVLSLARSFMYAGVPSLVVSLWQVNDASTADIMKSFYQNLVKGLHKDVALQQAKLAYIEDVQGTLAHPTFWSAFIQLGNSQPIAIHNDHQKKWLLGAIISLFLFISILMFFRLKSKSDQ